jgi:hypothetical protein
MLSLTSYVIFCRYELYKKTIDERWDLQLRRTYMMYLITRILNIIELLSFIPRVHEKARSYSCLQRIMRNNTELAKIDDQLEKYKEEKECLVFMQQK